MAFRKLPRKKYYLEILKKIHPGKLHYQSLIIRLVKKTRTIALVQAGMQADQFARSIDCSGNITHFTENHTGRSFFFTEDSKETCPQIFVTVIRKVKS